MCLERPTTVERRAEGGVVSLTLRSIPLGCCSEIRSLKHAGQIRPFVGRDRLLVWPGQGFNRDQAERLIRSALNQTGLVGKISTGDVVTIRLQLITCRSDSSGATAGQGHERDRRRGRRSGEAAPAACLSPYAISPAKQSSLRRRSRSASAPTSGAAATCGTIGVATRMSPNAGPRLCCSAASNSATRLPSSASRTSAAAVG